MPARARLAIAAVVASVCAIGIAGFIVHWIVSGPGRAPAPAGIRETSAVAPFTGYREVSLDIDGRCRRVVVADTASRRARGLRGHAALGPYTGMLFLVSRDTRVDFTMSGVAAPLDLVWYAADGTRVGGVRMRACPGRSAPQCRAYASPAPYRFALETPPGTPTARSLVPCS